MAEPQQQQPDEAEAQAALATVAFIILELATVALQGKLVMLRPGEGVLGRPIVDDSGDLAQLLRTAYQQARVALNAHGGELPDDFLSAVGIFAIEVPAHGSEAIH